MHGARDFATRSHAMRVASTWLHIQECDVYALLVDADKQLGRFASGHVDGLARALGSPRGPPGFEGSWRPRPVVLLLNKLDAVPKAQHSKVSAPADPPLTLAFGNVSILEISRSFRARCSRQQL